MSDSVRPHRRQPTRLLRPWDSPGKNTGVGCHFLLQCMKVKVKLLSPVRLLVTPWTAAYQAPLSMRFSRQEYWSGVPSPSPALSTSRVQCKVHCSLLKHLNHVQLFSTLPARLLCPWDFPGKSTGVGCHCLLCRCFLLLLSHFRRVQLRATL